MLKHLWETGGALLTLSSLTDSHQADSCLKNSGWYYKTEHLPFLLVLIETNGYIDTGEKLAVKKITAFKSWGTSVMIDYSLAVHYCHSYLFPVPVATDNGDAFLFITQPMSRQRTTTLIAEYELLKKKSIATNRLEYTYYAVENLLSTQGY